MQTLEKFHDSIKNCKLCNLHKNRTQVVAGNGDPNASIVFIGEGPGKNEDIKGLPFIGAAGKFLDEMLDGIGLSRQNVFIANTVKCRPPNNRDPKLEEIEACFPYLEEQLKIISPKIIVTLGKFALNLFFPEKKISESHGKIFIKGDLKILSLYHPAAALYNGSKRLVLFEDFQILKEFI